MRGCRRRTAARLPPHPTLRATFSPRGEGKCRKANEDAITRFGAFDTVLPYLRKTKQPAA